MPEKCQPAESWKAFEIDALRVELSLVLDAIDAAVWREQEGQRVKRICFAPTAIERMRMLLAK